MCCCCCCCSSCMDRHSESTSTPYSSSSRLPSWLPNEADEAGIILSLLGHTRYHTAAAAALSRCRHTTQHVAIRSLCAAAERDEQPN